MTTSSQITQEVMQTESLRANVYRAYLRVLNANRLMIVMYSIQLDILVVVSMISPKISTN